MGLHPKGVLKRPEHRATAGIADLLVWEVDRLRGLHVLTAHAREHTENRRVVIYLGVLQDELQSVNSFLPYHPSEKF